MKKKIGSEYCDDCEDELGKKHLFSEETRTIYIHHSIEDVSSAMIISKMHEWARLSNAAITIDINSPGGDVDSTVAIISNMLICKAPITTRISGIAFSAAGFIAVSGDTREISSLGSLMLHGPKILCGELDYVDSVFKYLASSKESYERLISKIEKRCGKKSEFFLERLSNKDLYLNPEEALEIGLIDKII